MAKCPELDWRAHDLSDEYKLFKQRMDLFFLDIGLTDEAKQAVKIKIALGVEGLRRINSSGLSAEDQKDPKKIWDMFDAKLNVKVNFRVHRLELMRYKQKPEETIDDFVGRCREKAKDADFTDEELAERIVELTIASTKSEQFQKELLEKDKGFSIDNLLKEGRKFEAIAIGGRRLNDVTGMGIDFIKHDRKQPPTYKDECRNCGLHHPPRRCPAYKDTCKSCGIKGHWAKKCRGGRKQTPRNRDRNDRQRSSPHRRRRQSRSRQQSRDRRSAKVNELYDSDQSEDHTDNDNETPEFHDIKVSDINLESIDRSEAYTVIDVVCPWMTGQHKLKLKVDTGASGNTLPLRTLKLMYEDEKKRIDVLHPTTAQLTAYNGTAIKCLGCIDMPCHYKDSAWITQRFYVVDTPRPAVIGLPACEALQVVTIHEVTRNDQLPDTTPARHQSIEDLKSRYPGQFDTIGSFHGAAKIHLKDDARPYIDAPRKCSIHIKPILKAELDTMVAKGIIRKVEYHTDWCSSITTAIKKDGSIRVCLDPKRLNNEIKRCPHKIPTLEELSPAFAHAKYFSKLDAKSGYWAVHLDKDSQDLTTFRTPFGRYCYNRLPFGLAISQDVFQQHMDNILERVPGCVGIADDVAVLGRTIEEHDHNLERLMTVAQEEGLVFNSSKCILRMNQIEFFGSVYSDTGVRPDPRKIEDINAMPTPQGKDDLQRFLGMVTYLAAYVPNFSDKAKPLRDLLKKDVPFVWHEDHEHTYNDLKKAVTSDCCLQYYDPDKLTVLEVDASMKGLGACLLQDNKPVAYASKSLSTAQSNYSNIEREMLAVVFGITRFHTYLYGKRFVVHSDHKPLEMISRKPLTSAPPRLQRLLVKIQGYDFEITYRPGSTMVLSDTLSRLPNPYKKEDVDLDHHVDNISIDLVNFGSNKQEALQTETSRDPVLRELQQIIVTGWPETIKEVPMDIRPYWSIRDELGVSHGVIFKGRQVLVPEPIRADILQQLHQSHMGIEKTRRLAHDSVYWPRINQDIESLVKKCEVCQENQPKQRNEPLEPHDIPTKPWMKLASDMFTIDGDDYLLMTDYHSKYPVLCKMPNTRSETVAKAASTTFSMLGAPAEIVSDNGPQYAGQPFKDMCQKWAIKHTTSSPRYPRSNGMAERTVRTVKTLIRKCKKSKQDLQLAMLHLRATPVDAGIPAPAEILFGRPVRTNLPSHHHPSTSYKSTETFNKLEEKKGRMKSDHDKKAGQELPPLYMGQKVRVLNDNNKMWEPAQVTLVCKEPRSYEVTTPNGSTRRRNRSHIREMGTRSIIKDDERHEKIIPKRVRFTDEPAEPQSQTMSSNESRDRTTNNQPENGLKTTQETTTRSGRVSRKPARFRDDHM
jgi:transposase InsO family protein